MSRKKYLALIAPALLLVACGDAQGGNGGHMTMATAGTGGTFYAYGGAVASQLSSSVEDLSLSAQSTGGSEENLRLLANGDAHVALAQAPVVMQGYEGEGSFEGEPQDLRILSVMYPDLVQLVALESAGLSTYEDLQGTAVSVGEPGSGVQITMDVILEATGTSQEDFGEVSRLGYEEQTGAMRNNQLDVASFMGPAGMSALQDLSSSHEISVLPFSDSDMEAIADEAPFITGEELPPGTYNGQDEAVGPIPSQWNYIVVPADMDEELAEEMALTIFENTDALAGSVPAAEASTAENTIEQAIIPLHPGAAAAMEELGVEVPDDAVNE